VESLSETEKIVCDKTGFIISNIKLDLESKDYFGSTYKINNKNVISRKSKITPKKLGQFVTFWKRNKEGITEPFTNTDVFDYKTYLKQKVLFLHLRKEVNEVLEFILVGLNQQVSKQLKPKIGN